MNHFELESSYLPIDVRTWSGFVAVLSVALAFIVVRYFIMVAPFYYWFWKKDRAGSAKGGALHDRMIAKGQIAYEIRWSVVSSFIFALAAYVLAYAWQSGRTLIYLQFDEYPLWYLPISFFLASIIHEIYFYTTHVWMHRPSLFHLFHAVHHRSIKATPWASFSFHPGEAIVQAAFLPLLVMILPLHPVVILSYLVFMTLTAISNHLGFELLASEHLKAWFISGDHHSRHHRNVRGNFGLYYCFMDKLLGTEIKE